jgi:hypothetical protein
VWKQAKGRKPANKGRKRSAVGQPFALPGALTGELSAYEKAREENIKVRSLFTLVLPVILFTTYVSILSVEYRY